MQLRTSIAISLTAALVACAVLGSLIWTHAAANFKSPQLDGTKIQSAAPEPEVALIDEDGRSFRLTGKRGKEVVLFFGYAHCPDVCPATLAKLAQADHSLGSQAGNVTVAFVTVDPQRDTISALKRYVGLFDPRFYGLTGSPKALGTFYSVYHVWHQKLPNHGSAAGYLMAHSSSIYMLDRDGHLRVIHDWSDSPAVLAHDMKALME
ncbi:MAG: SCO family protein [Candidatus Elarobacter sp.]